ncbi:MAG: transglycosylase domain-containing protein, partial [Thermodesulfobacteriales bacterium]
MKTFFLNILGVKTKWIAALTFSLALVLVGSFLLFLFLDYLYPFPTENLNKESTIIISDKEGDPLRFFLPKDKQWRFPVELKDIDPKLVSAVIESEDRWFYTHPGVNPLAIGRAFYTNIKSGQVVSGASTIPMQIARLSEPKNRTVFAKANEAFRALQLKWHCDDNELLKIYLNIAPYGGNLEGVGAASYFYFGKSPRALEPHEIALLTLLPRSPTKHDPTRNPKIAHAKRNEVINMLKS